MTLVELPRTLGATYTSSGTLFAGKHTPVDATTGAVTVTLPSPSNPGASLSVEKIDGTANPVTISGSIRGAASTIQLVWQYESVELMWTGASWRPINGHKTKASLDATYAPKATPTFGTRNATTGWFHVEDFGAKGDGAALDSGAIQAAIDAANAAYLSTGVRQRVQFSPKTYICDALHTQNPVYALMLKSGVELHGPGILKTAPGSYWIGTDYALLRSPDVGGGIHDAVIRDLTFDGNASAFNIPGGTTSGHNIVLSTVKGVQIVNVSSISANGLGIMVAGHSNDLVQDLLIRDCTVANCANLGIQVSQFDGIEILDNRVAWVPSNAIDIYGEPDSHLGSDGLKGRNFLISGNMINDCGYGIFPETVGHGIISNNDIRNVTEAIHVNRINAQPEDILITGNRFYNMQSGVGITGDTNGVTIRNNVFDWYNNAGIVLGGNAQTNVANIYIIDNTMNGNATTQPMVLCPSANHLVNIIIKDNITRNGDRSRDFVNFCTNNVNMSIKASVSPGNAV